jgi:hypothetical protein
MLIPAPASGSSDRVGPTRAATDTLHVVPVVLVVRLLASRTRYETGAAETRWRERVATGTHLHQSMPTQWRHAGPICAATRVMAVHHGQAHAPARPRQAPSKQAQGLACWEEAQDRYKNACPKQRREKKTRGALRVFFLGLDGGCFFLYGTVSYLNSAYDRRTASAAPTCCGANGQRRRCAPPRRAESRRRRPACAATASRSCRAPDSCAARSSATR